MSEIKNAKITAAGISIEHGVLSAYLTLEYGCGCQCFGGFVLGHVSTGRNGETRTQRNTESPNYCAEFIAGCLDVISVESWEKLVGQPCRVRGTHIKAEAIGNLLTDKWFDPAATFKAMTDTRVPA